MVHKSFFQFLHIPTILVIFSLFFFFSHYHMIVKWYIIVALVCSSLMISDGERLFICKATVHFLIGLFLLLLSYSFYYILDIIKSVTLFTNIFSHSIACLFMLLIVSFDAVLCLMFPHKRDLLWRLVYQKQFPSPLIFLFPNNLKFELLNLYS